MEAIIELGLRKDAAECATRAGLKKLATEMQLPVPPVSGSQRFETMEGLGWAFYGVPRDQAVQWLKGSGCGGVYLRPFWHAGTGAAVARGFGLVWARGQLPRGAQIWAAVRA